jgi:hypothetical protein
MRRSNNGCWIYFEWTYKAKGKTVNVKLSPPRERCGAAGSGFPSGEGRETKWH